jgi:hypothetical protein
MANYNKGVDKKEEVEVKEVSTTATTNAAPKRKKIDKDEEVVCRSVVSGELIYTSRRTNMTVEWDEYGTIQYLTVEELMTMKSQQKSFLTKPWIIIEDEDVVDYLGLRPIYENIVPLDDLEYYIVNTDLNKLRADIQKAPRGIKDLITDKARAMITNEELNDIRLIRVLNQELNIDLNLLLD